MSGSKIVFHHRGNVTPPKDLEDEDIRQKPSTTPVVVGETFACRFCGGLDVLGQELVLDADSENGRAATRLRIVGVSEDGTLQVFGGNAVPIVHLPAVPPSFVIRTTGPTDASGAVVRALQRSSLSSNRARRSPSGRRRRNSPLCCCRFVSRLSS